MIEVVRSVCVERPQAVCFDLLADVERYPEWQHGSGIGHVVVRGDDPPGLGTRFRLESRFAGRRRVWVDVMFSAFEPPARIAYRSVDWRRFALGVAATLTPEGTTTRVEWRLSLDVPRVLRPLAPLIAREIGHRVDVDLATFKRTIESAAV